MGAELPIVEEHFTDAEGNPAGGNTFGAGFAIGWQHGPTRAHGGDVPVRNGAFVEEILEAARGRLAFYQRSRFACEANRSAIEHIDAALRMLRLRTAEREARGVEGRNVV